MSMDNLNGRPTASAPFSQTPFFQSLSAIQTELRTRRKHVLKSYVSLKPYICENGQIVDDRVDAISRNLAERTVLLWDKDVENKEEFCRRFYVIAFYAVASGKVGNESIDDVIQLAECLIRSRHIFISVVKELLSVDMVSELFSFIDDYDDDQYYNANFEDAVMGSIAVLLGSLKDPVNP